MFNIRNIFKPTVVISFLLMFVPLLSQAADPNNGAGIYKMHCASCHGVSGNSVMIGAPNFAQGDALMSPDSTLLISIQSGKGPMPAYRGVLSDQDILDVIAYLRTFN
jgi:mono/diheme cytochrome c family protein